MNKDEMRRLDIKEAGAYKKYPKSEEVLEAQNNPLKKNVDAALPYGG